MRILTAFTILAGVAVTLAAAGCKTEGGPETATAETPAGRAEALTGMADVSNSPARSDPIPAGEPAPNFVALDQEGQRVELKELLAKGEVVLIFYPKDMTPGCTKQLCNVRDDWSEFQQRGAAVLGVNPDDAESHAKFVAAHNLTVPILVDEDSRIAAAYGCKGDKFTTRTVYVIGRDGKVLLGERGMVPHEKIFKTLDEKN